MTKRKVDVLYTNTQWMILRERSGVYLVERLPDYPDDLDGGFWLKSDDLIASQSNGRTEIRHVCEKQWVDMFAFEDAVRRTFDICGVTPHYDIATEIDAARQARGFSMENA